MFLSLDFTARPVSETQGIDFPKYKVVATVIIHSTVLYIYRFLFTTTGSVVYFLGSQFAKRSRHTYRRINGTLVLLRLVRQHKPIDTSI